MTMMTASTWDPGAWESRGFNRALAWSFGIHIGALVLLLVVPRDWIRHRRPETVMTISLGGTPGPRTTGTTNIGGRTVEQQAPPPRRPEPVKPAPKTETQAIPMRSSTPPPEAPRTRETAIPMRSSRPPVTGPQVTQGNTAAETGARGLGAGLTLGGGTGGEMDLKNFCCPQYLADIAAAIAQRWARNQADRGMTVIGFTINRDGSKSDITIDQASGSGVLDRASRAAVVDAMFPPLPPQYPFGTLRVHLKFPYGVQ
jgi:TonB family protein